MGTTEVRLDRVEKMVNDIWGKFLGLQIIGSSQPVDQDTPMAYFSWVKIIGNERITIVLRCPESLAWRTTAAMFETKIEDVELDQVEDCMKEIVNILGGNLKGTMTHYHFLSIPSVKGPGQDDGFSKEDSLGQFFFRSFGQDLQLTLLRTA